MFFSLLSISIVPEQLWKINGMPITNSLFTTWIDMGIIILLAVIGMRGKNLVPKGVQLVFEAVYQFFLNLCESVLEQKELAEKAVPFITTIFVFVFVGNLTGLIPGVGSIGFFEGGEEFTPLLRAPTSDLNTTIALALISVITTQVVGFKVLGIGYLKKFFNFANPVHFFVGILELISEFTRIISFSFRLFGNIFAGEVLLVVIGMLIPAFLPIPFYGLELFVALIQAFVFAMLTLVFIKLSMTSHHAEAHESRH